MSTDADFARRSGKETTWVLEAQIDGHWTTFQGLFVASIDQAQPVVDAARRSRPDLTAWRAIDRATDTILAEY